MTIWTASQMASIHTMLNPKSLAIVGATPRQQYGGRMLNAALRMKGRVNVYAVNPKYDDINGVHAPSADSLLEALLTDAALRSGGSARPSKRRKSRLEVKVSPNFTVSLDGEAAKTLDDVNSNLRLANRLLKSITRFFR